MTLHFTSRPRPSVQRDFLYTREMYHALDETGLFDGTSVELIRGKLIEMPPISDEHGSSVMRSAKALRRIFPEDAFTIRHDLPFIAADDSEPQPDLCVVSGAAEIIRSHPASCLLLIEISNSTLTFDRTEKASLYAESGVDDYWIINLIDRVVEIHRQPERRADGSWGYAAIVAKREGERCETNGGAAVAVADLLPAR